jgi:lipocalin
MAKPLPPVPYDLVLVEWVDASRLNDGWMDLAAIPEPYPHKCVTVGFVISKNERGTILVPTIGDTEHQDNSHTYGGMMIPASAIISERRLR